MYPVYDGACHRDHLPAYGASYFPFDVVVTVFDEVGGVDEGGR